MFKNKRVVNTDNMASKSKRMHRSEKSYSASEVKEKMPSSHLSALMMLSSQLLSTGRFNEGLPSFITKGLDSEQIWQQLELRNDHKLSLPACTREVVQIQSHKPRVKDIKRKALKKIKETDTDKNAVSDSADSSDSDGDENVIEAIKKRLADEPEQDNFNDLSSGDGSEEDDVDFDFEMDKELSKALSDEDEDENLSLKVKDKTQVKKNSKKASVVDDKFFKLADMEEFLDSEDVKEEKKKKIESKKENVDDESADDDTEDEEIDMFDGLDEESDDAMGAMYVDFFDPPEDGSVPNKEREKNTIKHNESMSDEDEDCEAESEDDKDVIGDDDEEEEEEEAEDDRDNENDDEDDESISEPEIDAEGRTKKASKKAVSFESDLLKSDDDFVEEPASHKSSKSSFEKKQEQLQAQAREMEEQSLKEAPWELTGEATASKRPENSLLETVLDFQHTTRAAPVITDETTKTLEDYIKQRIKDKAFDDVERKEKPKEDPFEFKKRIVLDQEKSKMSLGELYEQEFLKQQQQDKEEVKADPECEKIETDLKKLFQQLDALCNFRYTPMKAGTEVKIIVNTPAITMEEVAPTATADAQLLAPEEVREKIRGDLKADDERDSTDKKRDRRHKKQEKRIRKKAKEAREKVVEKMKPGLGNKYSKAKAIKQLEQIGKTDKNITLIKGDHKKLASSTAFFNQLQEEVQTNVRAKKAVKDKKKKQVVDASKLML